MRQVCLRASVLAAALFATPAIAAGTLDVGYSIAFWSIPFGHTDYRASFANGGYDAKSHFQTSGVVSLFWNSTIDATANGKIGERSIAPAVYDSYSTDHHSKIQRVKVTFKNDDPTTFADPPYNLTKYPVTDAQKKGSVDPMAAITTILAGVKADAKNPCGTGVQVFDGKRRYDVLFSYVKDEPLKLDNGLYNGTAHECQVHYNEIAGYKQKIIAEGKKLPPMYADFIDVPGAGAPAGHYVIAAKLWAATGWGTVTAQLSELKVNGAPAKS
ncbi:MAG: DUF3108 domain-containing protein [Rhizomicrobium sp.]